MSLFRRYVRHPVVSATGDAALIDAARPLDALRMAVLASNAVHLCEQNAPRPVRQHGGVRGIYAQAVPGAYYGPPTPEDIRWNATQKEGVCAADLGTFYVWPLPSGRMPYVRITFTAQVDGGHTLGWVFAVSRGERGPLAAIATASGTTTAATWDETTASINLAGQLGPLAYVPTNGALEVPEPHGGELQVFRAFLGGYNSSNSDTSGARANIVAITLQLEPPP